VDDIAAKRETILRALRALRLIVIEDQSGFWVSINDGHRPMRWLVPSELGRRYCNETIKHFKIPKEWIDNPLIIPGEEDGKPPC
jgi:hypothetical protein